MIALILYILGMIMMLTLVTIEYETGVLGRASPGALLFAKIVSCLIWPGIMLYALVVFLVDSVVSFFQR